MTPAKRYLQLAQRRVLDTLAQTPGGSPEEIASKLVQMTEAMRTVVATHEGMITDTREVQDNPVRLKALEHVLNLYQAFPAAKVDVTSTVRVEQLHALAVKFEELPPDRRAELAELSDEALAETIEALPTAPAVEPQE